MKDGEKRVFTPKTFRRDLHYDEDPLPRLGTGKLNSSRYLGLMLVFLLGMATMFVIIHIYCTPTAPKSLAPDEVRNLRPLANEGFPRVEEGRWIDRPTSQPASSQPH